MEEGLERLSRRLNQSETLDSRIFGVYLFYGLVKAGAVEAARVYFETLWDHPKIDRVELAQVAQAILDNRSPREASPFKSLLARKLGDARFTSNDLRGAQRFYAQAIQTDSNQQEAWVGLIRSLRARGLESRAKGVERRYEARFSRQSKRD